MTSWYYSDDARDWTARALTNDASKFHRTLPGYAPTPPVDLPALPSELGVGRVQVKDESARMGLPAFKVLGARGRAGVCSTGTRAPGW